MMTRMVPVCIIGAILFAALPASKVLAIEPMTGGWSSGAVTNSEVVAAANFAIKEEEKALQKNNSSSTATLTLVSIVSVEQQVVAGMNYRLKLKVKSNGEEKIAEATVWWQSWNKEAPYKLTSWNWQ